MRCSRPVCERTFGLIASAIIATIKAPQATPCLTFLSPDQIVPITTGVCTVSVEACDEAKSVEFAAVYRAPGKARLQRRTIGNITRPPYKLIWDARSIPNQLFKGMTLVAVATLRRNVTDTTKLSGIFLTHNPVERPALGAPYAHPGRPWRSGGDPIVLTSPGSTEAKAEIRLSWNEQDLMFCIKVYDPFFYGDIPKTEFGKLGAELMIDPGLQRDPYPSRQTMLFVVPLKVAPYRITSIPTRGADGSFSLPRTTEECTYPVTVRAEDFKGYSIDFFVPWESIGDDSPTSLGCNATVHLLDQNNVAGKVSWAGESGNSVYCPILWGTVELQDKPVLANPLLLWLASFGSGVGAGLVLVLLLRVARGMSSMGKFERTEKEERILRDVMTMIEMHITDGNLTLDRVAKDLSVSPRSVNRVLKRHHGETFRECLMRSRVEVVKERLRSSHSSETAIAGSCGFGSIDEMEKYFKKFCHTTPYRFREEHQVT